VRAPPTRCSKDSDASEVRISQRMEEENEIGKDFGTGGDFLRARAVNKNPCQKKNNAATKDKEYLWEEALRPPFWSFIW